MAETYRYLPKQQKQAIDQLDANSMDLLLKAGEFGIYVHLYDTLCAMCNEQPFMSEDHTACLLHPLKKWGKKASLMLYEMRKK